MAELGPLAKFVAPELREALQDKNALVRVKVAEALWKIEQTPALVLLPVLLDAMKDKEAGVRAAAPPVLALLGSKAKGALPALKEALKDKEFDVKLSAVAALGDLGPVAKGSAGDLLALTTDKSFFLLEPFVGAALGNLGESVVPALITALTEKSPERRRVAAYALGSMGPAAAPAVAGLTKVRVCSMTIPPRASTLSVRWAGSVPTPGPRCRSLRRFSPTRNSRCASRPLWPLGSSLDSPSTPTCS